MSSAAGAGGWMQIASSACVGDCEIRRRPYHRNCSCAMHRRSGCGGDFCTPTVLYPIRRSFEGACLTAAAVQEPSCDCHKGKIIAL
ncbi:hypothetical protein KSP40_PGU018302 [Platanthera guangdongensis]|uniref:Uncharacterized protein n=1 Tax=Platanthera guangdongensis TaxID=2320717 RepID=A0ABR2LVZ0_9ASPA